MRVMLGEFTHFSLERHAGSDLASAAQAALRHYARRLDSEAPPVQLPSFVSVDAPAAPAGAELELPIEPDLEAVLGRQARARGACLDQVVAHAVFVYLLDLGLAGDRVRSETEAEEGSLSGRYGHDAPLSAQDRVLDALDAARGLDHRDCGARLRGLGGSGCPGRR